MKKETFDKDVVYSHIFYIVCKIPKGRITTYGAIATTLNLTSARIVGHAMGSAMHVKRATPVQRVVNSQGLLSGDNGSRKKKLEAEGITIENNKVKNFKQLFWNPLLELEI